MLFLGPTDDALWGAEAAGHEGILEMLLELLLRTGAVVGDADELTIVTPHVLAESFFMREFLQAAQRDPSEVLRGGAAAPWPDPWGNYLIRLNRLLERANSSWVLPGDSGLTLCLHGVAFGDRIVLLAELFDVLRPPDAPDLFLLPFGSGGESQHGYEAGNLACLRAGYRVRDLSREAIERLFALARHWLGERTLRDLTGSPDLHVWGVAIEDREFEPVFARLIANECGASCDLEDGQIRAVSLSPVAARSLAANAEELARTFLASLSALDRFSHRRVPGERAPRIAAIFRALGADRRVLLLDQFAEEVADVLSRDVVNLSSHWERRRVRLSLLASLYGLLASAPLSVLVDTWGRPAKIGVPMPEVPERKITRAAIQPALERVTQLGELVERPVSCIRLY